MIDHCASCGSELIWALLKGKPHPFDAEPQPEGEYELEPEFFGSDRQEAWRAQHRGLTTNGGHVSHLSTCIQAKEGCEGKQSRKACPDKPKR